MADSDMKGNLKFKLMDSGPEGPLGSVNINAGNIEALETSRKSQVEALRKSRGKPGKIPKPAVRLKTLKKETEPKKPKSRLENPYTGENPILPNPNGEQPSKPEPEPQPEPDKVDFLKELPGTLEQFLKNIIAKMGRLQDKIAFSQLRNSVLEEALREAQEETERRTKYMKKSIDTIMEAEKIARDEVKQIKRHTVIDANATIIRRLAQVAKTREAKLEQVQREKAELQQKLNEKEGDIQELTERIAALEVQEKVLKEELDELQALRAESVSVMGAIAEDFKSKEIENLTKEVEDLKEQLDELEEKNKLLTKQNDRNTENEADIDELRNTLKKLRNYQSTAKETMETLTKQKDNLLSTLRNVNTKLKENQSRVQRDEKTITDLESKYNKKVATYNKLVEKLREMEKTNEGLSVTNEELEATNEELKEKAEKCGILQNTQKELEMQVQELQMNLEETERKYDEAFQQTLNQRKKRGAARLTRRKDERKQQKLKLLNLLSNMLGGDSRNEFKEQKDNVTKLVREAAKGTFKGGASKSASAYEKWNEVLPLVQSSNYENLFEYIEEARGGVRVYVRVRPGTGGKLEVKGKTINNKQYSNVFTKDTQDIWDSLQPTVETLKNSSNQKYVMMGYGPSGSGKTYTFFKEGDDEGLVFRMNKVFGENGKNIEVRAVELYGISPSLDPKIVESSTESIFFIHKFNEPTTTGTFEDVKETKFQTMTTGDFKDFYEQIEKERNPEKKTLEEIEKISLQKDFTVKKPRIMFSNNKIGFKMGEEEKSVDAEPFFPLQRGYLEPKELTAMLKKENELKSLMEEPNQTDKGKKNRKEKIKQQLKYHIPYWLATSDYSNGRNTDYPNGRNTVYKQIKDERLRVKATPNNKTSSRSHLFVTIRNEKKNEITWIDAAGSESWESMHQKLEGQPTYKVTTEELREAQCYPPQSITNYTNWKKFLKNKRGQDTVKKNHLTTWVIGQLKEENVDGKNRIGFRQTNSLVKNGMAGGLLLDKIDSYMWDVFREGQFINASLQHVLVHTFNLAKKTSLLTQPYKDFTFDINPCGMTVDGFEPVNKNGIVVAEYETQSRPPLKVQIVANIVQTNDKKTFVLRKQYIRGNQVSKKQEQLKTDDWNKLLVYPVEYPSVFSIQSYCEPLARMPPRDARRQTDLWTEKKVSFKARLEEKLCEWDAHNKWKQTPVGDEPTTSDMIKMMRLCGKKLFVWTAVRRDGEKDVQDALEYANQLLMAFEETNPSEIEDVEGICTVKN